MSLNTKDSPKIVEYGLRESWSNKNLLLNELEEFRREAYENVSIYKERTKKWNNENIQHWFFREENQVLLYNSRLKPFPSKLKSRWSGPFMVSQVFPYGKSNYITQQRKISKLTKNASNTTWKTFTALKKALKSLFQNDSSTKSSKWL